jgi:hypothetical protein
MLAMLLGAAAIYGVANSSAFAYAELELEGATFTDRADVLAAIDTAEGENLFLLATRPLADAVAELSTVRDASVSVSLPDTLVVRLEEREAILVWQVGEARYLVDTEGVLFARVGDDPSPAADALPVIDDRRSIASALSVDRRLDAVDLDAATRLASLVPSDVGSSATALTVHVTDESGFVLRSGPSGWAAVFGYFTPSLRTPELIPGQVRLLRSLLIGREHLIERVILASETDGTYIPKPTPKPTPKPSATPAP